MTSKEPAIVSAITNIMGDDVQHNDLEEAADFLLLTALPLPKGFQALIIRRKISM